MFNNFRIFIVRILSTYYEICAQRKRWYTKCLNLHYHNLIGIYNACTTHSQLLIVTKHFPLVSSNNSTLICPPLYLFINRFTIAFSSDRTCLVYSNVVMMNRCRDRRTFVRYDDLIIRRLRRSNSIRLNVWLNNYSYKI